MKKLILLFFIAPFTVHVQGMTEGGEGALNEDKFESTSYNHVVADQKGFFNESFGRYLDGDYDKWRFVISVPVIARFSTKLRYLPDEDAGSTEKFLTTFVNRFVTFESKDIPAFGLRADVYRIFSNNLFLNLGAESFLLKKAYLPIELLIDREVEHIQPYSVYLNLGHIFPQTTTSSFALYFGFGYNILIYKQFSGPSIESDKDFLYQVGVSYMLKRAVLDLRYSLIQDDKYIDKVVLDVSRKSNISFKLVTLNVGFYF